MISFRIIGCISYAMPSRGQEHGKTIQLTLTRYYRVPFFAEILTHLSLAQLAERETVVFTAISRSSVRLREGRLLRFGSSRSSLALVSFASLLSPLFALLSSIFPLLSPLSILSSCLSILSSVLSPLFSLLSSPTPVMLMLGAPLWAGSDSTTTSQTNSTINRACHGAARAQAEAKASSPTYS